MVQFDYLDNLPLEVGQVSVLSLSLKAEKEQYLELKNVQILHIEIMENNRLKYEKNV
jgi:hypothetical protein